MRGKGEGSVYRVPADKTKPLQYWTGTIELPSHDGDRRRVTVRRKSKTDLLTELDALRSDLKKRGDLPTSSPTVEQWFTHWFEQIVLKEVRPKTAAGYKSVVFGHIVPEIGKVKLNKLTATHIRRIHDRITVVKGLSSTYALNAHRIMSASFEAAIREGRLGQNPAKLTNAPRKSTDHQEAFEVEEAIAVLEHVLTGQEQHGARWAAGLLTGARRGEILGLEVDRVSDVLDLSWQLQRLIWAHGCGRTCGKKTAAFCPLRKLDVPADFEYRHVYGGLYLTRPKSSASWRIIPLVDPLKSILDRHLADSPPNPFGLVFVREKRTTHGIVIPGEYVPLDPDRDTREWRDVLAATGIERDVVLHGLRHTAVDLLYLAEVPEDIIMEIVGQSTRSVTRGYRSRGKVNRTRMDDAMTKFSALFNQRDDGRSETLALDA